MGTITYSGTLVTLTCWCGIHHAIPSELRKQQEKHKDFAVYCPLGHRYVIAGETEAEKYRRLYESTRDRETAVRAALDQTQRSLSATRGVLTKTRKRIGNGVCPECRRHFVNVDRHMATQHQRLEA